MHEIRNYLPDTEILAQLAEEAAELAQAALKLRRVLDGTNPTPVKLDDAFNALLEKYSDVVCCCRELNVIQMETIILSKKTRWAARLKERGDTIEKKSL